MIHTVLKTGEQLSYVDGLPRRNTMPTCYGSRSTRRRLKSRQACVRASGSDTRAQLGNVVEEGEFLYLRSQLVGLDANGQPHFASVTFVLGDRFIATVSDDSQFRPFVPVFQRCKRKPSNAESPKALLRLLLQTANDSAAAVIDHVADALVQTTVEISEISDGYDEERPRAGCQRPQRNDATFERKGRADPALR